MGERTAQQILSDGDGGDRRGIECPKCGCAHYSVVYIRHRPGLVMRKKECRHCQNRIVTYERAATSNGAVSE